MTDFTNIQGVLRVQADHEGSVPCTTNQYRARIMREAAEHIERLERDTSVAACASMRNELAAVKAELDAASERAMLYANNLDIARKSLRDSQAERNKYRDAYEAVAQHTRGRPRYVVQQVNGFGPHVGQRQTWYKIVDTAHPIGRRDFKRVGVAYDATDARHIAEMFEARST